MRGNAGCRKGKTGNKPRRKRRAPSGGRRALSVSVNAEGDNYPDKAKTD